MLAFLTITRQITQKLPISKPCALQPTNEGCRIFKYLH